MTKDSETQRHDFPRRLQDTTLLLVALLLFVSSFSLLFFSRYQDDRVKGRLSADLLHAPAELIAYQQISVFTCPVIGEPTCFAVRENTFIIGTADPHTLMFFDGKGTLRQKIDLPEEPTAIACGTAETIFSGKIVVVHPQHIAVYSNEGDKVISWKLPGEESNVRSLVLTADYLFTADTDKRCVYRFNVNAELDLTFGDFVVYASPIVMTYSPQTDLLYIANPGRHRVAVFTQEGEYLPESSWGEPSANYLGFAGCCNPIGLAVLDDGRILTVEKSISRVKLFRNSVFDCIVAGPIVLDALPPRAMRRTPLKPDRYFAVAILSEGRIAVFDFECSAVRLFAKKMDTVS